ncbi:MAG: AAA family ATPase [Coriobacteriia bacterium]|nr:AAA family ATPase [Coriobacteriia bacterium]
MSSAPYLLVVVGPNGSGKSSIIEGLIEGLPSNHPHKQIRMINADFVEKTVAEISVIDDSLTRSREAQMWCLRERKKLRGKRESFGYETVGSHTTIGERHFDFMQGARERGYYVEMLFVSTEDPRINLERVKRRVARGGHDVDPNKIVERYKRTMEFLPHYLHACDAALVVDNSIDDAPYRVLLRWEDEMAMLQEAGKEVKWLHTYYSIFAPEHL